MPRNETLGESLRQDIAKTAALRLRIGATDAAQLAAGLTELGPKFDALRERVQQWAGVMLDGEKAITELLSKER